jgi:hypothetical protein
MAKGLVQVNVGDLDQGIAFVNWIKGAAITSGSSLNPATLDNDGYPVSTTAAAMILTMQIPVLWQDPSVQWVLKSTGTRTLKVDTDGKAVTVVGTPTGAVTGGSNSAMTVAGTAFRVVFTFGDVRASRILNLPAGNFYASGSGDLILCRVADESSVDAGGVYNQAYLDMYGQNGLNVACLRTMAPQFVGTNNACTQAQWRYRPPVTGISYHRAYFQKGAWAGTATGTDQYTVSAATDTNLSGYDIGELIQFKATNASNALISITGTASNGGNVQVACNSTATLSASQKVYIGIVNGTVEANGLQTILTIDDATHFTINVPFVHAFSAGSAYVGTATLTVTGKPGGSATKPIISVSGQPIGGYGIGSIGAGSNVTLIYNNILDAWLFDNSNGGITGGWPIETQVSLCNSLGCDIWVCLPPLGSAADWQSVASYVSSNLSTSSSGYFEFANEVGWNPGSTFQVLASSIGKLFGFAGSFPYDSYYAVYTKIAMEAVTAGWGVRSGLKRVIAIQTAPPSPKTNRLNGAECVTGNAVYNAFTANAGNPGGRNFNVAPNKPIDACEILGIAPYIDGANLRNTSIVGWGAREKTALQAIADAWNAGTADAALQLIDNEIRKGITNSQTVTIGGDFKTFTGSSPFISAGVGYWVLVFSSTGTMPTNLTAGQPYYGVNPSGNTTQISLTLGGAAISGISGGTGTLTCVRLGGGPASTLLNYSFDFYPVIEAIAASYDTERNGRGQALLSVQAYEGGLEYGFDYNSPTNATWDALGLTPTGSGAGSATVAIAAAGAAWWVSNYAQKYEYDYLIQYMAAANAHFTRPSHFLGPGPTVWSCLGKDFTVSRPGMGDGLSLFSRGKQRFIGTI